MPAAPPSLFNKKTIGRLVALAPLPDAARQAALKGWADAIASGRVASLKETELHGPFMQLMIDGFGYTGPVGHDHFSITQEQSIVQGSVDLALGVFSAHERKIVAPFELKGADTKNLDAIMPGRAKTPVDQAWEYATNNVGTKWVLVSNYIEIRLYSYGEGRQAYETFDLSRLHLPDEYARAQMLLSAESLLGGRTAELLDESRREHKDITNELYKDYAKLRKELIDEVGRELPELDGLVAIRTGQKILDRILFIAFAEDTGLLPAKILESAFKSENAFNRTSVWENFLGLFKAIDKGDAPLKVPRYNGGLFKPEQVIGTLKIPDHICEGFKRLSEYDFASEVSVTVLGHIFEQSIADVEQLQAEARGDAVPEKKASGTSGRRKRDGVVYTPDYIARFIVEQTLGTHCREIFDALLAQFAKKGATRDDETIQWKTRLDESRFWFEYRRRLSKLRIVDPACGSGVFLVMAFDWLKVELTRCVERLNALGVPGTPDPDSEILTHNLFGVDVNEESVEIAKLSLWIKTARHGKVLDSLDKNFVVGDSLIEDSSYAYRSHGFVWKDAFAEVFAEGGFDIVLGNPPYVKGGLFSNLKPYLKARFEVYDGSADLYAYFFERAVRLLRRGGRLGYISSGTFFKTSSGQPLRQYLSKEIQIEVVVDFADHQVFAGVTTYPIIFTAKRPDVPVEYDLKFWKFDGAVESSFQKRFDDVAQTYPSCELTADTWTLESAELRQVRKKIVGKGVSLRSLYGVPYRGVLTGRNDVFVIDRQTREELIKSDSRSTELLRPWLEGDAIQKWRIEPSETWLIFTRRGVDLDAYPAIKAYLENHRAILEPKPIDWTPKLPDEKWLGRKSGSYGWYEMQDVIAYHEQFSRPKILYRDISAEPTFSIEKAGLFNDTTSYFIPEGDAFLLALLNSKTFWFWIKAKTPMARGGFYRFKAQYIEQTPIPPATDAQKAELAALAEAAQTAAEARYKLQQDVTRRIPDLSPPGKPPKLTERLKAWWDLPDFAAFRAEVKKAFKADIPLSERTDWENWIAKTRPEIHALTAVIAALEREIDAKVYALFDLTPDEIALLEASI